MSDAPYYFGVQNYEQSRYQPNRVHVTDTGLAAFFQRSLLQKAVSQIVVKGAPDYWPTNYLLYSLFSFGFCAVINTDRFGVIPQHCSLSGRNVFYQPSHVVVANPLIKTAGPAEIGETAGLLLLQPDYGGIWDTVSYYADMMALAAQSVGVNLINTKLAYVLLVKNKAAADTAAKLYDQVASGKPAVVFDKAAFDGGLKWELFDAAVKNNFIAPELVTMLRTLEQRFCTEVGIRNANTDKRERLISDEVNANNDETLSRLDLWLDTLNESAKRVNKLFGLNLVFERRRKYADDSATGLDESKSGAV